MAGLGEMNIKVGADIADALTKINQLKQANIQLAEETSHLSAEYKKNADELRKLEQAQATGVGVTNKTASSIKALTDRQKQLTASIVDNKAVLKQSTAVVNTYEKSVGGAGVGSTKLTKALGSLTSASDYAAKGVKKLEGFISSGLQGAAVGLAVAIGGAVVEAFTSWIDSINNVNRAQEKLNGALAEASGSVAGEVANLESLVAIARDTSLSYDTRTQAVKELNKEYPALLGNLTVENSGTVAITAAINKQIAAIKRRAEAKAVEKLIDEAQTKLEKARLGQAEEQGANMTTILASAKDQVKELGNTISKGLGAPGLFGGTADSFHEAFVAPINEAVQQIDLLSKKLAEINLEAAKEGTLFTPPPVKPPKAVKAEVIKSAKETAEVYTETLQHALAEIFKRGFKPEDDPFASLKKSASSVQVVFDSSVKERLAGIKATTDAEAAHMAELERTANFVAKTLDPVFDDLFTSIADGSKNAFEAFGDALVSVIKQLAITVAKAAILAAIMNAIAPGSGSFSTNFNKILGFAEGGEVKGPGTSKSDSILARLSKGEFVMKADAVQRIGVENLNRMNKGTPPSWDNFLGGRIPKFASGGFISPSMVNSITGSIGGGHAIEVFGRIEARGDKLVTIIDRANSRINRNT